MRAAGQGPRFKANQSRNVLTANRAHCRLVPFLGKGPRPQALGPSGSTPCPYNV